jgi:hypothetical protein
MLANELETREAPRGWKDVVKAVYVSSLLIMVGFLSPIQRIEVFELGDNVAKIKTDEATLS